jgi:ribosomal protein L16/L10AE
LITEAGATTITALRRAVRRCSKGSNEQLNVGVSIASTTAGRVSQQRREKNTRMVVGSTETGGTYEGSVSVIRQGRVLILFWNMANDGLIALEATMRTVPRFYIPSEIGLRLVFQTHCAIAISASNFNSFAGE